MKEAVMAAENLTAIENFPETLPPIAERFSGTNRRRLSAPGLRTFLMISELWGLTDAERLVILGMPSRSTYRNWSKLVREQQDITLNVDTLIRISIVLGIHQALGLLYPDERDGVAWLRTPSNALVFGGRAPMMLVTSGSQDGLLSVRRFLDAARDGHYMPPNQLDQTFRQYADADIVFT